MAATGNTNLNINSSSWLTAWTVIYPGTDVVTAGSMHFVSDAVLAGKYGDVRLYDYTNAAVVAELLDTVTGTTPAKWSQSISAGNLPAAEAIFEVQARKSVTNGGQWNLRSFLLRE